MAEIKNEVEVVEEIVKTPEEEMAASGAVTEALSKLFALSTIRGFSSEPKL